MSETNTQHEPPRASDFQGCSAEFEDLYDANVEQQFDGWARAMSWFALITGGWLVLAIVAYTLYRTWTLAHALLAN